MGVRVSGVPRVVLYAVTLLVSAEVLRGAAPGDEPGPGATTRLLRQPTVSAAHIAFAYASNIWIVEIGRAHV